jgi:hypothetical protein
MSYESNILEIPVDKAKNANDLAKWFELNKIHQKKHPSLSLPVKEEFPVIFIMGLVVVIAMALTLLEEKGKLKAKKKEGNKSSEDFLDLIKNSKTESSVEKLIESRYDLDLILHTPHHGSVVSEPASKYTLDDVFGIWKNKKNSLDKVREEQWGKRK